MAKTKRISKKSGAKVPDAPLSENEGVVISKSLVDNSTPEQVEDPTPSAPEEKQEPTIIEKIVEKPIIKEVIKRKYIKSKPEVIEVPVVSQENKKGISKGLILFGIFLGIAVLVYYKRDMIYDKILEFQENRIAKRLEKEGITDISNLRKKD